MTGAFSPDGRTFAAAIVHHPESVAIELIDPATGRTRATLRTRHPSIYRVAFSPDGRAVRAYLGAGPHLEEVVTWDAATGEETSRRPVTPPTRGSAMAISPDGRTLAFIPLRAGVVWLWDLEADRRLGGLTNPSRVGTVGPGLAFSPDGRTLAAGDKDGAIEIWDVATRKLLRTIPGHSGGYASSGLRFSPDGRTIASAGQDTGRNRTALGRFSDDVTRSLFGSAGRGRTPRWSWWTSPPAGGWPGRGRRYTPIYSPDGKTVVTRQEDPQRPPPRPARFAPLIASMGRDDRPRLPPSPPGRTFRITARADQDRQRGEGGLDQEPPSIADHLGRGLGQAGMSTPRRSAKAATFRITASPSAWPICCEVASRPEASPCSSSGMPEVAAIMLARKPKRMPTGVIARPGRSSVA